MAGKPITENTMFYGDNLPILHEYVPDESIDLIYLDPPFNSNRTYNVLFKDESGLDSEAQIAAFEDTWHWTLATEETYHELVTQAPDRISKMIAALRDFIGTNQMMAYLVMMAIRLIELHRVLKPTASLYLHCDPTASHYLKAVLDTIFGPSNFRNEIIWQRTLAKGLMSRRLPNNHDVLLCYQKGDGATWNDDKMFVPYDPENLDEKTAKKFSSRDIRDLRGTVEREKAGMGVFITLEPFTAPMEKEAVSAGFFHSAGWNRSYPKIQILTIEELMQGKEVDMPPEWGTFKQAQRVGPQAEQPELGL
jgi:DNA modification methylase